jgi:hypothetical protein
MAKIKNNISFRIRMPAILSLVIVLVIALELAAAYFFWYRNLEVTAAPTVGDSVVRVDLPGYRNVIQFLDSLVVFTPNNAADDLGSPFVFR